MSVSAMPTDIIVAIITSGFAAIASIVGMIFNYFGMTRKRRGDQEEKRLDEEKRKLGDAEAERDHEKQQMAEALLKGVDASLDADEVILIALRGGKLNGNVEAAMDKVRKAHQCLDKAQLEAVSKTVK